MVTLSTTKERYDELIKSPLLFLRKGSRTYERQVGSNETEFRTYVYWEPVDNAFRGELSEVSFPNRKSDYMLTVVERPVSSKDGNIEFSIKEASVSDFGCWIYVINSYIQRSEDNKDLYPYLYLLWFLNHNDWTTDNLYEAICRYPIESRPFIATGIGRVSKCLSLFKQEAVQQALKKIGISYTVYQPDFIGEALRYINPQKEFDGSANNLFELVDYILVDQILTDGILDNGDPIKIERSFPENTENKIIRFYKWLHSEDELMDYQDLPNFFFLVGIGTQLRIIQRYFHDVRLQKTCFDVNLIKQFKDNPYSCFSRYRHCMITPQEKTELGNSLLADCLITLYETRGELFQSFNGVLDLAITHCDITQPKVNFGLKRFIPQCQGGYIRNQDFLGFIDYELLYKLDETQLTDTNLWDTIRGKLRNYREQYSQCSSDGCELEESIAQMCKQRNCENVKPVYRDDLWNVPSDKMGFLNPFLQNKISKDTQETTMTLKVDDISVQTLRDNIKDYVSSHSCDNDLFVLKSKELNSYIGNIVKELFLPVSMRIYPQSYLEVGGSFDMFGILETIKEQKHTETSPVTDEEEKEWHYKESVELRQRCIESLSKELKTELSDGGYFEQPYNESKLRELKSLYYVKDGGNEDIKPWQYKFLVRRTNSKYSLFCAPELAKQRNKATDMPFFWCRGIECFHNSLRGQTLSETTSWRQYTLFHMAEIIGYPMSHDTEAGPEPNIKIRTFIAVANKVLKQFNRMKCRACGHLLFAHKTGDFNRLNYYSCANPTCPEYMHPVYLNYCYSCKKGLIDSRDSKQCPNGWYICPTCNACCNNSQYERMARRYFIQHKPIPEYIESKRGLGHNDKGLYYCYKCGKELENISIGGKTQLRCPICKESRMRD